MDSKFIKKPVILIICNYYLPGYKSGGSLRTIVNTIERLNNEFDFFVITLDHDGDQIPYKNVKINKWNKLENAKVFYLSKDAVKISKIRELILEVQPNSIYINSVFSILSVYVLMLRRLSLIPSLKLVLAPEGELSVGALQLKKTKKNIFLKLAKIIGLHKNLIWKTTSEFEKLEAERISGKEGLLYIAPNLPSRFFLKNYDQKLKKPKKVGELSLIFLSRHMRKKNLNWLIELLPKVTGNLRIDIYGPLEDEQYWMETAQLMKKMPKNILIEYKGTVLHEKAVEVMFNYHFFILPTLGENFGHVFIEALAAGCPLIISDRTPWINLEQKQIGWDITLENPLEWIRILNYCINLDKHTYSKMSENSREYACQWLSDPKVEEDTLRVLKKSTALL